MKSHFGSFVAEEGPFPKLPVHDRLEEFSNYFLISRNMQATLIAFRVYVEAVKDLLPPLTASSLRSGRLRAHSSRSGVTRQGRRQFRHGRTRRRGSDPSSA